MEQTEQTETEEFRNEEIRLSPQEVSLIAMFRNFSTAITVDVHAFLDGIQKAEGDRARGDMILRAILENHHSDVNFMGMVFATSAQMVSEEAKVELVNAYTSTYESVLKKIAFDWVQSAKEMKVEEPVIHSLQEPRIASPN